MKKAFIPIFLAFVLFSGNVGIADAATLTQSQISAIVGLLRSFGADEGTIANVNSTLAGTSVSTTPGTSGITSCPTLKNTLYRGSSDSWTGGEVSMLQRFLRQLYPDLPVTGYFGVLTEEAVVRFQSQYGITPVGIVGPETSKKIASLCGPIGYPIDPLPPVSAGYLQIEPSSASIAVGESKSFQAFYQPPMPPCPSGAFCAQVMPAPIPVVAEWTSSNPGVASIDIIGSCAAIGCPVPTNVLIKGISNGTADIKASYKSPYVFERKDTVLTATARVTVGSVPSVPSVTVLSPNGGETWIKGSTQTIKWRDNTPVSTCPVGAQCAPQAPKYFDIKLLPYYPPCTTNLCPAYYPSPYTIAKSVSGSSYSWSVGKYLDVFGTGTGGTAPDGSYTIQVSQTGESGIYDVSDSYFKIVSGGTIVSPNISGVSGPTTLQTGQQGTWTVNASDPNNGTLSYSVVWGDEDYQQNVYGTYPTSYPVQQSATFTHAYNTARTYYPKFTVSNTGGSSQTSLSVVVGGATQPSITVLSPNGGETWTKGTTQTIKWRDNTPVSTCPVGAQCAPQAPKYFDIKLLPYSFYPSPSCTGTPCPAYPVQAPFTIAKSVSGSSYSWSVGKYLDVFGTGTGGTAPDGSYTIQVSQTGESGIYDVSDSYFKIVSGGTSTNNPPVINGIPAIPVNVGVGQSVSFSWSATDADNDNLAWGVSWGDGIGVGGACQSPNPQNKQGWTFNTSHAWASPGTYTVRATVNDCRGGSDEHAFNVTVGSTVTPSITVLSPNGGEVWTENTRTDSDTCSVLRCEFISWSGGSGSDWRSVTAYLEQNTNGQFITVGKIPAYGFGSIGWPVGIVVPTSCSADTYPGLYNCTKTLVNPGQYYVRLVDKITGATDRSNAPFSIVGSSVTSGVTVSLEASTPAPSTIAAGSTDVPFLRFRVTNTTSQAIAISSFSVNFSTYLGSTASAVDIPRASLWDGATKLAGANISMSGGTNFVVFNQGIAGGGQLSTVNPGTSKVFTVSADISPTARNGVTAAFALYGFSFSPNGISTGMPVTGNSMTIVSSTQPSITVISPNGGEQWQIGKAYEIKWLSSGIAASNNVQIELSGTNIYRKFVANVPGSSGAFLWTVPSNLISSDKYSISVTCYLCYAANNNQVVADSSNAPFSIVNNVALATPVFTKLSVPTNTLTNGTQVLYRFRATTISSQDASISSLQFPISLSGVAPISLSDIALYGYSDSGFSVQAYSANPVGQRYGSIESTVVVFSQGDFPLGVPLAIPAGTSRYFEVRGYVNTGSFAPVSVTTSLSGLGSETLTKAAQSASTNPVGFIGPVTDKYIYGWACIPGDSRNDITVRVKTNAGSWNTIANTTRGEPGFESNSGCKGVYHGFELPTPTLSAGTYTFTAAVVDPGTGTEVSLTSVSGQTTLTVISGAPSLSSVSPSSVIALQPEAFNIYGFNFQPGATIVYSGPSSGTLAASFVNSTQLFLSVPGGLLQGTYTFKVRNLDGKESVMLIVQAVAPSTSSGQIISMTPNPCTVAQGATRCPVTIMWSAFNAPLAGIRAKDSVSGWEGLVCAADKTLCTLDAAPGNYVVKLHLVATDPNSQILDQKSGVINPPSTLTGGATSGADLVALSISPSGPFTVGQSVTFSAVVKNAGGGAMPGSGYDADLMIDYGNDNSTCQGPGSTSSSGCNAYVGSPLSVPLIAPGATHTFSIPWTATCQTYSASCTNLLRFRVDLPYNLMPESNETNNYITKIITVQPAVQGAFDAGEADSLAALLFSLERQLEELERLLNSLLP